MNMKEILKNISYRVSLIGIKGVPANYGGFETFAENLVIKSSRQINWIVYAEDIDKMHSRKYNYESYRVPFKANGLQSMFHDAFSVLHSIIFKKAECVLCLGYSGSWILPFVKIFFKSKIITNIDGLEWRREKHNIITKKLLYSLEQIALEFSDVIIVDNQSLIQHIKAKFIHKIEVVEYGGDHLLEDTLPSQKKYEENYDYSLSRIVPENKVHLILEAYSKSGKPFKYIGNWLSSKYGKDLFEKYSIFKNIELINPIYDLGEIKKFRSNGATYIHGHSVGGTNPSLVEAIFCNDQIICFDCDYNRTTMNNTGNYFSNAEELFELISSERNSISSNDLALLKGKYSWSNIVNRYITIIKS